MAEQTATVDTNTFAFTHNGPWNVNPATITWLHNIAQLRRDSAERSATLGKTPKLPPVGRFLRVGGTASAALIPWALRDRRKGPAQSRRGISKRLRKAALTLGPTYIKLGQIVASGDGLFPPELVEEFKLCRDQVPAEDFHVVKRVIEEELGGPIGNFFASIDPTPLAAASIAAVYAARLTTGEEVVIKVQRDKIRDQISADLRVMAWLAPFLIGRIPVASLANPPAIVELFADTIVEELDFRLEAANMLDVARSFVELHQDGIVIARPHPKLVTRRVLVMERLHGIEFDDIHAMAEAGIDTEAVLRNGMSSFTKGCLVHGLFHGDMHGGNLFITHDGNIALLDFGITARMSQAERTALLRLIVTAMMGQLNGQIAALRDLGALPQDTDIDDVITELRLDAPPPDPTAMSQEEMVAELQRVVKSLLAMGARLPKVLMLFVKNLVFFDSAIAHLAPELDIFAEIAGLWSRVAQEHGAQLSAEIGGLQPGATLSVEQMKKNSGIPDPQGHTSYADLRRRRQKIRERMNPT